MKKAKLVYGKSYIFGFFFSIKNFLKDKYIQKYFYGFLDKYFFCTGKGNYLFNIPLIYIK